MMPALALRAVKHVLYCNSPCSLIRALTELYLLRAGFQPLVLPGEELGERAVFLCYYCCFGADPAAGSPHGGGHSKGQGGEGGTCTTLGHEAGLGSRDTRLGND